MERRLPPLNWLRAFESAARHLSFTQAATELGLTQAAISKQVRQLELHLREQLFVRNARSLELTKTAQAYLPKVREAFDRLTAGTQEVFGNRRAGLLTIRSSIGFSVNWLAPRLPDFRKRHPNVEFRIISTVWNEEAGKRTYDLDIRYGGGDWSGFRIDRLSDENLTPVCCPHLVDSGQLQSPSDLASLTLLHVLGYEEGWATWLQKAGMSTAEAGSGLHVDNSLLAFEIAATGAGVALGRSLLAQREIEVGQLVAPFELSIPTREAFFLLSPEQGPLHDDAEIFRNWLLVQSAGV